jgi:hypothetical protein
MEAINPSDSFDFRFRDDYSAIIYMYKYGDTPENEGDTAPESTYMFALYDAFPLSVEAQQVTWADEAFQRINIIFSYSLWRRPGVDETSTQYQLIPGASVIQPTIPVKY